MCGKGKKPNSARGEGVPRTTCRKKASTWKGPGYRGVYTDTWGPSKKSHREEASSEKKGERSSEEGN